jgi:hypothetical protein
MLGSSFAGRYTVDMNEPRFEVIDSDQGTICHDAEWYLYEEMEKQKVGLVNDTFVVKTFGKCIMVALKTAEVEGGTIEPGYWYEFEDYVLRSNVRQNIDYFGKRIHIPGTTVIRKSRRMREQARGSVTQEELLEMANTAATELAQLAITEIEFPLPYPPRFPREIKVLVICRFR